ncbi:MAG: oligosaccharide flippase family protein [Nitrososphaerales archaeon]
MSGIDLARRSTRGSVLIFVGSLTSTALLAITSIIIARLLGPANYGIYTLSLVLPAIFQIFVTAGINVAIERYSAFHISKGDKETAARIVRNGVYFLLISGTALTVVSFLTSGYLSTIVLHRQNLGLYVQVASIYVLGQTLYQAALGSLIGSGKLGHVSLAYVFLSIIKLTVSFALIVLGFAIYGAIVGQVLSYLFTGVLFLFAFRTIGSRSIQNTKGLFLVDISNMLRYSLPLFFGGLIGSFALQYITVILSGIATNTVVGLYQVAASLTLPLALVVNAIIIPLFPAFASMDGRSSDTNRALIITMKYSYYLAMPVGFFIISCSSLLISVLYGSSYAIASEYLNLYVVAALIAVGPTVLTMFFSAIGKTRLTLYGSMISSAIIFVLAPALSFIGVYGLLYTIIIANVVQYCVYVLLFVMHSGKNIALRPIGAALASSLIPYYIISNVLHISLPQIALLVVDGVLFITIYLTLVPIFHGVNKEDINRLNMAIENLGLVKRPFRLLLRYEGILLRIMSRKGRDTNLE